MQTLRRLARYGGWANRTVFDLCRDLDQAALLEPVSGTIGTIRQTLEHLVAIEDDCRQMLEGRPPLVSVEEILAWLAPYRTLDLAALAALADQAAASFERALAEADDAYLDGELRPPAISRRDWLLHVFTHSVHHRAQVLTALGQRGLKVPDVDYTFYLLREGRPSS